MITPIRQRTELWLEFLEKRCNLSIIQPPYTKLES